MNPNIFFSADHHAYSKNIIGYCNRPYKNMEEMTEALITNHNSKVGKGDVTYFLGDTVWGHQNYKDYFKQLNGTKIIILGNHDNEQNYKKLLIDGIIHGIYKQKGITVEGQYIWLSHYPHRSWNRSFHGSWHLYGHVHNTCPDFGLSTDAGVDKWNFYPVSFEELKEYFKDREKYHNSFVRDDYKVYDENFHKHFIAKYKERTLDESKILGELL